MAQMVNVHIPAVCPVWYYEVEVGFVRDASGKVFLLIKQGGEVDIYVVNDDWSIGGIVCVDDSLLRVDLLHPEDLGIVESSDDLRRLESGDSMLPF